MEYELEVLEECIESIQEICDEMNFLISQSKDVTEKFFKK